MPRPSGRPMNERTKSRPVRSKAEKSLDRVTKKRKPVDLSEEDFELDQRPSARRKKKPRKKGANKEAEAIKRAAIAAIVGEEATDEMEGPDLEARAMSKFHQDFDKLKTLLAPENEDFRVDQASPIFFRASLAMILDLLPIAEAKYRKSKQESAAYALNAMIGQARDLTNDVRMSEDTEGQALVLAQLLNSSFLRIAELLLAEKFALQRRLEAATTDPRIRKVLKNELNTMVKSYTKGLVAIQELTNTQQRGYLVGDPNYINPNAVENKPKPKKRKKT